MKRLATIALLLAACTRTSPPMVTAVDAQRSNVELADLQRGRKLLLGKCAGCHRTPMPADHTRAEWPTMLAEMSARAKLDDTQRALIEQYLVTMAPR